MPPVPLPAQLNDRYVILPAAPEDPPTRADVLSASNYRENVDQSYGECPIGSWNSDY